MNDNNDIEAMVGIWVLMIVCYGAIHSALTGSLIHWLAVVPAIVTVIRFGQKSSRP